MGCADVELLEPSAGSVPHSNQAVVASPFGITFPLRVALPPETEVAVIVVTEGTDPAVKLTIVPHDVPELLLAKILK
jgi:hypothetical protein